MYAVVIQILIDVRRPRVHEVLFQENKGVCGMEGAADYPLDVRHGDEIWNQAW